MKLLKLKTWLKIGNSKRLYIAGDYFTDGKFLINKKYFEECNYTEAELKRSLKLIEDIGEIPNYQKYITDEKNLRPLLVTNDCKSDYIDFSGYKRKLVNEDEKLEILIDDEYILGLADIFKGSYSTALIYKGIAKDKPVQIYNEKDGELVGMISPFKW